MLYYVTYRLETKPPERVTFLVLYISRVTSNGRLIDRRYLYANSFFIDYETTEEENPARAVGTRRVQMAFCKSNNSYCLSCEYAVISLYHVLLPTR